MEETTTPLMQTKTPCAAMFPNPVVFAARGIELNEARLRMAALPSPANEVLFTPGLWVPLAVVDRVYVLPGIPRLFQAMVSAHQVGEWASGKCGGSTDAVASMG
jgi:molybdopterin-biosynthesis enzyme MoeA-like protein